METQSILSIKAFLLVSIFQKPQAPVSENAIAVHQQQLDANLVAADVSLDTKELGRQQSGTAVLFLARAGSGWKLVGIDLFEVR